MSKKGTFRNLLSSILLSLLAARGQAQYSPTTEDMCLRFPEESEDRVLTQEGELGQNATILTPKIKDYTVMLRKGTVQNIVGSLLYNTATTYFQAHGAAMKYYNATTVRFTQEIDNTDKILYSSFVDNNVFFLVSQSSENAPLVINSYVTYKYTNTTTPRSALQLKAAEGTTLEIYKINRFADTKIFYIFAKETDVQKKNVT